MDYIKADIKKSAFFRFRNDYKLSIFLFHKFFFLGVAMGIITTYILKTFRFLANSAITEVCIILLFGYLTYLLTDILDYSGVISLLTIGIFLSHYAFYNLTYTG